MTAAQKTWMDAHPTHQALGNVSGHAAYKMVGTLAPDGTIEPGRRPLAAGAFWVGVLDPGNQSPVVLTT